MSTDYQNEYSAYFMQKIKNNISCDITIYSTMENKNHYVIRFNNSQGECG